MNEKPKTRSILQDAEPAVGTYLSSLGFSLPVSRERFTRHIESRFGQAGQDVLRAMDLRADDNCSDDDFYPLKNSSLPLSLAFTFWEKGGFYASFLSWMLREGLPSPSRILDLGCDNGVLTCFYAQQFPHAEVIGIDLHQSSIDRARELATQLAVQNASFQVLDLNQAGDAFDGSTFDLVTATHVLNPDLESCRHVSSLGEVEQLEVASNGVEMLACIRHLTTPDIGLLLTTNSFDDRAVGLWTRMLSRAGFSVNWRRSSTIYWANGCDEAETCPVFVAENRERSDCWTVDDALAFCSYPEFVEKAEDLTFSDSAAEAVFRSCNPKVLAKGAEVTGPEGEVHHLQLWTCGPLAFIYQWTSGTAWKSLSLFSAACLTELVRQLDAAVAEVPKGSRIEWYDCLET